MSDKMEAFIRANTRLLRPPLVPEVQLHLAEESLPIWQKSEEELGELNVPPPYWAFAWAGGQALARHILDHRSLVAGQTVLDIGSGSGLVAIAAMLAGARHATANDIDNYALAACRLNAAANAVHLTICNDNLLSSGVAPPDAFDVIFIGDVFYEKQLAESVMAFAASARTAGGRILAGDPRRSYFPADRFRKIAEYRVAVTRELEDSEIKNSAVWDFLD